MGANYNYAHRNTASEVYSEAYNSINNGRPFVVFVTGSRSTWHYITIVGYTNVTNPASLSANNFLIIDSVQGCTKSTTENMGSVGYNLKVNGTYQYAYTNSGSVGFSVNVPVVPKGTKTISNGDYVIVSALDTSKCVDVYGAKKDNATNVHLWSYVGGINQTWKITYSGDGYYTIMDRNSGKYLDVKGAGMQSGTNVQIYSGNNSDAQKWVIEDSGDGWFNIISKCNGLYLDVLKSNTANGTNIQMWGNNGNTAQKWRFTAYGKSTGKTISNGNYTITSAIDSSKCIDVSGAGKDNSTNVQIWTKTPNTAQTWSVTYLGDGYYSIFDKNSGKSLDVQGAYAQKGTNVQIYTDNGSDAQRWIIKSAGNGMYYIISKCNGLYVDVNGGVNRNGTNIQMWCGNGSNAQKWKFTPAKKTNKITASNFTKTASRSKTQTFSINAKANGGSLKYSSNNKKITVNSKGKVTIPKNYSGKAVITISTSGTSVYESASKKITVTVKKAANKITASNFTKTASASRTQTFSINAKVTGGTLKYSSNNSKLKVNSKGQVTIPKNYSGEAVITISTSGTSVYGSASKKITVTVKPAATSVSSAGSSKSGQLSVKWKKNTTSGGYVVECSTNSKFTENCSRKKITSNATTSTVFKNLKKNTKYYIRIRAIASNHEYTGSTASSWKTCIRAVRTHK